MSELLATLRARAGLSAVDAATAIGCSRGSIYAWETGSKRPTPRHLAALMELYGATPAERRRVAELGAFGEGARC